MFGSFRDYASKSVLVCLQAFQFRRVDAVEKGIAVIEPGMNDKMSTQSFNQILGVVDGCRECAFCRIEIVG